jgi:hypothetical protein
MIAVSSCQGWHRFNDDTLPAATAGNVWTYITQTNPYRQWEFWPGKSGIYPGRSPHGPFLKLYANDIALHAAKAGKPMPNGAIIVKENYGRDKETLTAVTLMYKMDGYHPDAGDWFWASYDGNGRVATAGKPKVCIQCHAAAKAGDWMFTKNRYTGKEP